MTERELQKGLSALLSGPPAALLLGQEPAENLGWRYVTEGPHDAVMVGSLTYGELLSFRQEAVFVALSQGKPVYLWTPGLPHKKAPCQSRPLLSRAAGAERELRALGLIFLEGPSRRRYISAAEARKILASGLPLPPGAILSPLARDIWKD